MDTIYDAKLLIVDDNAELLALLCEQLRGAGYGHIRTAQSCAAARACFAAEQPELMILDINLPDGDGFSLFRALRAKADVPALLRKLAENRGHIVTYDALCAAVWGADYYGYENSLGVHIRHLREKLEAEPGTPQFLRTVRGIGYKLTKGEEA